MTLMTVMTTKTTMMTMMMSTHCIDRRTYVDPVLNYWAAKPDENWKAFDDTDDECAGDGFDLSKAYTPPTMEISMTILMVVMMMTVLQIKAS